MKFKIIFFIIVVLSGCTKDENIRTEIINDGSRLIKKVYSKDHLKEFGTLTLDSVKNGMSILFYPSGDTASIIKYKDGKKDSVETNLYKSGNLKSLRTWKTGHPWGEYIVYFDGLKEVYYTKVGDDTVRVEEPLKKEFNVYNHKGDISYQREYDKSGNLIKETGSGILFFRIEGVEFDKSDTVTIQYYLATPDWVTREFRVDVYDYEDNLVSSDPQKINDEYNAVFYSNKFERGGDYKIIGISNFIDDLTDKVKTDSVSIDIKIKESKKV